MKWLDVSKDVAIHGRLRRRPRRPIHDILGAVDT